MRNSFSLFIFLLFSGIYSSAQPIKPGTDEMYQSRLATLKSPVELIYRSEVKIYIDAYLDNPEQTRLIIAQSKSIFPMIERALRSKNVPTDLKYFAVAVSELNPAAQNTYGATGLWMLMYNVSRMYKMKINSFVDERRDPFKSSLVAGTHFKDLYSIYHQWPLVIAAYASSPVMLNKCIRMSGNSLYFWDIYPNLPDLTKDIYPKYIAAVYIMNFYREHGIRSITGDMTAEADSVLVNKWLSFQQISATLDIPVDDLRKLNPVYKKDVIPYNLEGYWLFLPKGKLAMFDQLKDSVYNPLPKPTDFNPVIIQKGATDSLTTSTSIQNGQSSMEKKEKPFDKKRVFYVVKKGDILSDIADWFDVEIYEIKSWNKLRSEKVLKGKRLTIWVNEKKTGYYKRINSMSVKQKKKLKKRD